MVVLDGSLRTEVGDHSRPDPLGLAGRSLTTVARAALLLTRKTSALGIPSPNNNNNPPSSGRSQALLALRHNVPDARPGRIGRGGGGTKRRARERHFVKVLLHVAKAGVPVLAPAMTNDADARGHKRARRLCLRPATWMHGGRGLA